MAGQVFYIYDLKTIRRLFLAIKSNDRWNFGYPGWSKLTSVRIPNTVLEKMLGLFAFLRFFELDVRRSSPCHFIFSSLDYLRIRFILRGIPPTSVSIIISYLNLMIATRRVVRLYKMRNILRWSKLVGAMSSMVVFPTFVHTLAFPSALAEMRKSSFVARTPQVSMSARSSSEAETIDSSDCQWSDILPHEQGSHNSAKVVVPSEVSSYDPFLSENIANLFQSTVLACKESGKSSMWVHVPMTRSSVIEKGKLFELGFRFHHAEDSVSVLNLWLKDSESKVPNFSTHNVGVGAFVVNSRNEVLCVRELRKNYMPWKTPTGLSELGEPIEEAAIREVLEETGIRTTFHSVLGFRQTHGMAHGRSDMYFVCRLDPVEEKDEEGNVIIPEPCAQECEIESAEWIPFEDYKRMVDGRDGQQGHPMMSHVVQAYESGWLIEKTVVQSVVPGRKLNAVFFPR